MSIATHLHDLQKELPASCKLIAVSKTQPVERVEEAYRAGHRLFGENKVQELVSKYEKLPDDIEWHMIGHLQSNKVKFIAPFVSLIHGVDSVRLLYEINKQARKIDRIISCLLQVHIAEEETKFGFSEGEIMDLFSMPDTKDLSHIKVKGLMGMATFTENKNQVRAEFRSLRALFDKLRSLSLPHIFELKELSMGMSGDYKIAVEEGSTMVRIGTAIFGERNAAKKEG